MISQPIPAYSVVTHALNAQTPPLALNVGRTQADSYFQIKKESVHVLMVFMSSINPANPVPSNVKHARWRLHAAELKSPNLIVLLVTKQED